MDLTCLKAGMAYAGARRDLSQARQAPTTCEWIFFPNNRPRRSRAMEPKRLTLVVVLDQESTKRAPKSFFAWFQRSGGVRAQRGGSSVEEVAVPDEGTELLDGWAWVRRSAVERREREMNLIRVDVTRYVRYFVCTVQNNEKREREGWD